MQKTSRRILRLLPLLVLCAAPADDVGHDGELCSILPPNDMRIPVRPFSAGFGITQGEFNAVLDRVQEVYGPIISRRGGVLEIQRKWKDSTVNAKAQRITPRYIIEMFGGLARHDAITPDGFAVVACHEIGHHLGGAPRKRGRHWASIEGQADYFAPLKCLRRLFKDGDNLDFVSDKKAPPEVMEACSKAHESPQDRAFCARAAMGGLSVAQMFHSFETSKPVPDFATPDPAIVESTRNSWPENQCRLDTYFAGALCPKPADAENDYDDPAPGTCTRAEGYAREARPRCWYKPPETILPGLHL